LSLETNFVKGCKKTKSIEKIKKVRKVFIVR
jgi:hypothetical protein